MPDVTVQIRNIAVGGHGVGEVVAQDGPDSDLLGITAFVPFAARGETVKARIVEQKERFLKTELVEVLDPSSTRVEPKCPLFTKCGGCELQHLSYEDEHASKLDMIRGALRAGRFESKVIEALKPIVGGDEYGYRRRVNLHVDTQGHVGFFQEKSRAVVPVSHCPIAVDSINQVLVNIQEFGALVASRITSILLETDESGVVAVLKSPYDLDANECRSVLDKAKVYFPNAVLQIGNRDAGGYGRQLLELPLRPKSRTTLRVPAGYFSQVNWTVNQKLVERLVYYAETGPSKKILDLYAGAGNFSLPLASAGANVTAVECDEKLIRAGRQSAANLSVGSLEFIQASVEQYFKADGKSSWDVVIADPPRSGLGGLAGSVPKASKLILVYCHLPSFIRDLKVILNSGWKLVSIEPFDMFSKTSYVEVLAIFDRDQSV